MPLAPHFIAEHGSRRRHVERLDVPGHRDGDHAIAMFEDIPANPLPFAADD